MYGSQVVGKAVNRIPDLTSSAQVSCSPTTDSDFPSDTLHLRSEMRKVHQLTQKAPPPRPPKLYIYRHRS